MKKICVLVKKIFQFGGVLFSRRDLFLAKSDLASTISSNTMIIRILQMMISHCKKKIGKLAAAWRRPPEIYFVDVNFPHPDCSKYHCRTTDDGYKANGKGSGGIFSSPTREKLALRISIGFAPLSDLCSDFISLAKLFP